MLKFFLNEEDGQGMVEYALILALIAVACILVLKQTGEGIQKMLNKCLETIEANT